MKIETMEADVLIVGAGSAGIMAAIRAQEKGARVLLITNGALGKDSAVTWMTGGGFQCALYPPDSPQEHARDTVRNGSYINSQELVVAILNEGPRCIADLDTWGERFWKDGDRFMLDFMPGHSYPRCVLLEKTKSTGEIKGYEHRRVLPDRIRVKKVPLLQDFLVTDLLTADGRAVGAAGIDVVSGEFKAIAARTVVLATGGYAACYKSYLTGPSVIGWGHGMAYRAGAEFMDMEMVDLYPYCAVWPKLRCVNIWAANLRYGLSGKFMNRSGFEFFDGYRKRGLARPQSIYMEVKAGRGSPHGGIYLSFRHVPVNIIDEYLNRARSTIWYRQMTASGIDIKNEAVEIVPMALSTLGGVKVDRDCRTSVPGLYAIGELISGFDGAHTLAGNLMISCFATGSIAGEAAAAEAGNTPPPRLDEDQIHAHCRKALAPVKQAGGIRPAAVKTELQGIAWESVNIAGRTRDGLVAAGQAIEKIKAEKLPRMGSADRNKSFNREWGRCLEIENMIVCIEMTILGALTRTESRGLHFRDDFPRQDPDWIKNVVIRKDGDEMAVDVRPVALPYFQPQEGNKH
ncbi:MAG: FAD-binding protein [Desulfobacterales bacterium]|nr:FAD-binding protein [Desulfobacterales bacterium]